MSSATPPSSARGNKPEPGCQYFPNFSAEVRVKIWTAAASIPRIIIIKQECGLYRANLTVPAVLHVSREARKAGMNCYTRVLSGHLAHPLYINLTQDTLFFPHERDLFMMASPIRKASVDLQANIRNVMIGNKRYIEDYEVAFESPASRLGENSRMWRKLQNFRSLTTLTLNLDINHKNVVIDPRQKIIASFRAARQMLVRKSTKKDDGLPEFKFRSIESMNTKAQKSYEESTSKTLKAEDVKDNMMLECPQDWVTLLSGFAWQKDGKLVRCCLGSVY